MSYWYYSEPAVAPNSPLLLFLHGAGETGGEQVAQTTTHGPWSASKHNANVSEQLGGFFRAAPHIPQLGGRWEADMLQEVVLRIRRQHPQVAQDRLFLFGISRGGWGALELAARYGQELDITGLVVCCPESVDRLETSLDVTPVYLFHSDVDQVVALNATRLRTYNNLQQRANFRWINVRPDRTLGRKQHNCWTYLLGHPSLYQWFNRLSNDPNHRNQKDQWPDFADLAVPR